MAADVVRVDQRPGTGEPDQPVVLTPTRAGPVNWEELGRYLEQQPPPELIRAPQWVAPPPQEVSEPRRGSRRGVAGLIDWIKELLGARPGVRRDDGVQPVLAREQLRYVPQASRVYASPEFLREPYAERFDYRPTLAHEWAVRFGSVAPNPPEFRYPVPADPIPLPRATSEDEPESGNTFRASSLLYSNIKA